MKKAVLVVFVFLVLAFSCTEVKTRDTYILDEIKLVPEGIAYSESQKKFYLSSIAQSKIISLDRFSGKQEDFIDSGAFGFMPGVGILVDEKRNQLHALAGYYPLNDSLSSLFTFDLNSRELVHRFDVADTGDHFLNDLIQDSQGTIYMTDSKASAIYRLTSGASKLEKIYQSEEIQYPNGIAISEDDTKLYIASFSKGVRVLDLSSGTILNEPDTLGISNGIDGLEFYKGHLYGIQNGLRANGDNFRRLLLNKSQDRIVGMEVLDANNPDLDIPLTFCIVDNTAVLIANSNLQFLDQRTLSFTHPDSLKPTQLLTYDLGNN